jgi:hypothetical protein
MKFKENTAPAKRYVEDDDNHEACSKNKQKSEWNNKRCFVEGRKKAASCR